MRVSHSASPTPPSGLIMSQFRNRTASPTSSASVAKTDDEPLPSGLYAEMDQKLHETVKLLAAKTDLGGHLDSKPSHYVIAVQLHDANNRDDLLQGDFLWIKGNHKVTITKIKRAYGLQPGNEGRHFHLNLGTYRPPDTTAMANLNHFHDRLVVFKAEPYEDVGDDSESPDPLAAQPTPFTNNTASPQSAQHSAAGTKPSVSHASMSPSLRHPPTTSLQSPSGQSNVDPGTLDTAPSSSTPLAGTLQASPLPTSASLRRSSSSVPRSEPPLTTRQPMRAPLQPTNVQLKASGALHLPLSDSTIHYSTEPQVKAEHYSPSRCPMGQAASYPPKYGDENAPLYGNLQLPPMLNENQPISSDVKPELADAARNHDTSDVEAAFEAPAVEKGFDAMYLHELTQEATPEKLEEGVCKGIQLLDLLEQAFGPAINEQDGQDWLPQIAAIRKDAARTRTVVGVVGNTGAGKSALLNALLDEERLLPTNCMRACTAVVTEISYNDSDDPESKYCAEVEFVKAEEWEKELNVLFEEVLDGNGNISREVYNADSDAGIAYAKIRAVYFKHSKEDLVESSVQALMQQQHVRNVLGTTQTIKEPICSIFYKRLQHYVDSKEKSDTTRETDEQKKSRKREMEFWPLIRRVRIFTRSDALSTGAVLVDLPGVHDSNAARAAVAEGYMKQCTGLWIVAPITRAVDDKAAKNLLGDVFRRQLKYDGTYSAVTFICSKSDDISLTEATDSLDIGDEMNGLEDELQEIEVKRRDMRKKLRQLRDEKSACQEEADEAEEQQEYWEKLQDDLDAGKTVYAPSSKKRKRSPSGSNDEIGAASGQGPALTEDDIESHLSEYKAIKRRARRQRTELNAQIEQLNSNLDQLSSRSDEIEARRSAICIAGRNKYSKSAIQVDFATGIKELDQENQAEENPDTFNPEEDVRNYDEVANSLPVFCVSSRAYQKLSGRLVKDNPVKGFTDIDQTEIPALQAHAKKLTEGTRCAATRSFLNGLSQLCTSLRLWATSEGLSANLTGDERDAEYKFTIRKLLDLEKALEDVIKETLGEVKDALSENIFEHFAQAVILASNAAPATSSGWGAHRLEGGLHYSTYKATVRRDGVYAGSKGPRDFNAELAEPLYKHLGNGWEKAFQRRLPAVMRTCGKTFSTALHTFHRELEERARRRGVINPRLGLLARQMKLYEAVFVDLANAMVASINEQQREVNRQFTPVVRTAMERAYTLTTDERGTGSFARMKDHMSDEVMANKDVMFVRATRMVQDGLNTICKAVEQQMSQRTDMIFVAMRRDYIQALGHGDPGAAQLLPKWQRAMRREIEDIILRSDQTFKNVIEGVEVSPKAEEKEAVDQMAGAEDVTKDGSGEDAKVEDEQDIIMGEVE